MTSDKLSLQISISSSESNSRCVLKCLLHRRARVYLYSLEEDETELHQLTPPASPLKQTSGVAKRKRRTVYTAGK